MHILILCRSLTSAQKAARVLQSNGIFAAVTKAPQSARADGCGYGVKLAERNADAAVALLNEAGVTIRGIIEFPENEARGGRR